MIHLHHVHLFSHDLDGTVAWYRRAFDAEVYYDGDFGGSRNVFMKIGTGRMHFTRNRRPIMAKAPSTPEQDEINITVVLVVPIGNRQIAES